MIVYPPRRAQARFWARAALGVAVMPVTVPVELARHLWAQRGAS